MAQLTEIEDWPETKPPKMGRGEKRDWPKCFAKAPPCQRETIVVLLSPTKSLATQDTKSLDAYQVSSVRLRDLRGGSFFGRTLDPEFEPATIAPKIVEVLYPEPFVWYLAIPRAL